MHLPQVDFHLQYMEELLKHYILMNVLSSSFDQKQWQMIIREPVVQFQEKQKVIHALLLKQPQLRDMYFERFERNHLKIYGWYLLASRDKIEIEGYLYRPLLQKTPSFHNSKLSTALKSVYPHRNSRTQPNEVRKLFGETIEASKARQELILQESEIDSHKLYLQTFAACRGERYVPYDYDKHMKSGQTRVKYNVHIRKNHKRNLTSPTESQNSLQRYEEWERSQVKTCLLNFRAVLGDSGLNSERGLQKLLKRQGTQKLVFVNHQRKPINYYLRSFNSMKKT